MSNRSDITVGSKWIPKKFSPNITSKPKYAVVCRIESNNTWIWYEKVFDREPTGRNLLSKDCYWFLRNYELLEEGRSEYIL